MPDATAVPSTPDASDRNSHSGRVSRRSVVKGGATLLAGVGIGGSTVLAGTPWRTGGEQASASRESAKNVVPFRGAHQSGILTPAQEHLHFASFDMVHDDRGALVDMLKKWTVAAEQMMSGQPIGAAGALNGAYDAPPDDTGEALDLPPANLSITIGFGTSLFSGARGDALGITARRPKLLEPLPHFPGDKLDPERSDGDICVQVCADDPQVALHAVRNLARIGFGVVSLRWSQLGYGRTSSTSTSQETPRNLFGFKDGTANLKAEGSSDAQKNFVWAQTEDGTDWMAGGSYLVARRITMHIETWDRTSLREQEAVVGRTKGTGAPLSGGSEFSAINLAMKGRNDEPVIAKNSHVRLTHPTQNKGVELLRRGYNFADGSTDLGRIDAGLFFVAFVRNPAEHYVPMQMKLSKEDGLMEYLQHTGSALFAIPPGVTSTDGFIGESLFT